MNESIEKRFELLPFHVVDQNLQAGRRGQAKIAIVDNFGAIC